MFGVESNFEVSVWQVFSEFEFSLFENSRFIVVACPCGQRFFYHALQIVLGPAGGKKSVKL